jgi:hypothetical protein
MNPPRYGNNPKVRMPPLFRRSYPAAPLVAQHPPRIGHPNKRVLIDIACAPEVPHGGTLELTRWALLPLRDTLSLGDLGTLLDARPDLYDYQPAVPGAVEWHLNLADPVLFVAYDSPLFAQDEMQVAEHPALGSLREALEAEGVDARTVTREGPTPVLIKGVERRGAVDTAPDAAAGRPMRLYGNAFALANEEAVRAARAGGG